MPAQNDTLMFTYIAGIGFVFLMLGFVLVYIIVYQQKMSGFQQSIQQKELEKQFEVYEALIAGEEKERKRLSEELHDGIGAQLSGIKMNIEFLKSGLAGEQLLLTENLYNSLNETIVELREISHNLQPSVIGVKGLKNAIADLVNQLNHKKSTQFQLYWNVDEYQKIEKLELTLFRICTELLTNILKHANAKQAFLQILTNEKNIQLIAEDNGIGFKPELIVNGIGLLNIKNRVEHENGTLVIDSNEANGTTIIIELPIPNIE